MSTHNCSFVSLADSLENWVVKIIRYIYSINLIDLSVYVCYYKVSLILENCQCVIHLSTKFMLNSSNKIYKLELLRFTRAAAPCLMFSCPLVSISVSYLLEGGAVIVKVDVGVFNCVQNMYLNECIIFVGQNIFLAPGNLCI